MPLVYLGTGWFIGIALTSALHLPFELLLPAFLVPIVGLFPVKPLQLVLTRQDALLGN